MLAQRKDLAINKGNTVRFDVQFKDQNDNIIVLEDNAMVYFTVKETSRSDEYIFQKHLGDGIEYSNDKKCYVVQIDVSDTEELNYKDYFYDIAIVRNTGLGSANKKEKTTALIGDFTIGHVATFEQNEISEEVSV